MSQSMRSSITTPRRTNSAEGVEDTFLTPNGFREYDVRWQLNKEINANGFLRLGQAYGTYLLRSVGTDRAIVGYDFRRYSQDLSRSFIVGLLSSGVSVIDIGLGVTPLVYFAQHRLNVLGAAMVTASHNENDWTGLKLANGLSSTLMSSEIQAFREIVYGEDFESGAGTYSQRHDICEQYLGDLKKRVRLSTASRVVIGTGNGTAGHFAPRILRMSGCEVIEHHCELNWDFPNYNPNPEDLDFLRSIGDRVRDSKAELGLAIDGDGDRLGVVNEHGKEVFSDKVGLLLSRWLASRSPGCTIVIDVKSTGLYYSDPVLKEHGVRIEMVPTGHSYVKDAVRRHNAVAGFERSGHWFFNEPFGYGYDDANLAALYVLAFIEQTGSTLADMALGLRRTWQTPTMSIDCPDDEKYGVVESVTAAYSEIAQAGHGIAGIPIADITTVNGVRFTLEDGSWGLIRASSNKPSLVVVAESFTSEDQLYEISRQIKQTLATAGIIGSYDQELPDKKQQCGGEVRDGQRRIR